MKNEILTSEEFLEEYIYKLWTESNYEDEAYNKENFTKSEIIALLREHKEWIETEYENKIKKENIRRANHVCVAGYEFCNLAGECDGSC